MLSQFTPQEGGRGHQNAKGDQKWSEGQFLIADDSSLFFDY